MPHTRDPDCGAPIGYLPRWSYRAGDMVDVHVWCKEPWRADIVRLHYGDPRADGPGLLETAITSVTDIQRHRTETTFPGSMAWAPVTGLPSRVTLVSWVRPTYLSGRNGPVVFCAQRHDGSMVWGLGISSDGNWQILRSKANTTAGSVAVGEWHLIQLTVDTSTGFARLRVVREGRVVGASDAELPLRQEELAWLTIGGRLPNDSARVDTPSAATFDGVISQPCLIGQPLTDGELDALADGTQIIHPSVLAAWSFPAAAQPEALGPAVAGAVRMRNTPAAAMPGPHGVLDALHCHSDDLTDAEWPVGTRVVVPDNTPSGIYAVRLRSNSGIDRIPFVVQPPPEPAARALLVLPTMTYLAYANEMQPAPDNYLAEYASQAQPGPLDRWLARHPEYGFSTYDRHADGSGVNYSSLRRPIPNIRPDYLHWLSGEPRHLGADLFISDWLDRTGIPYDVVCDHDLDDQGFELLEPYRVVLTGSHPEYCTQTMLEALERHLNRDGRLMYLGGNGFYWVTSTSCPEPTVIEVRRGPAGYPWQSTEGESTHAFDGRRGGFWTESGHPPKDLVGVTFVAMGPEDPAPGYGVNKHLDESVRWVLQRVDSEVIGKSGRLMGGAAGHEIDCVVEPSDSPNRTSVIASSSGHSTSLTIAPDLAESGALSIVPHSDLVLHYRAAGGQVLSAGSICWPGGLAESGGDRSVQSVTRNVLQRFLQVPRFRAHLTMNTRKTGRVQE